LTSQETKKCQDSSSVRESEAQKPQKDERPELERQNGSSKTTSLSLGDDYFLELEQESQKDERPEQALLIDSSTSLSLGDDYVSEIAQKLKEEERPDLTRLNGSSTSFSLGDDPFSELPQEEPPSVRWSEDSQINIIERLSNSCIDEMFYTEDELGDQRHEAWMEECGLDPSDYD
jgi:hypothetical protein